MANIHADAAELEKAADKKRKQTDEYIQRVDQIGDEIRSTGPATRNGRIRRHGVQPAMSALAAAAVGRTPIDLAAAFFVTHGKPLFENISGLWAGIDRILKINTANTDPARHAELRDGENNSFIFHTAMIGTAVKEQLDREVAEVQTLEHQCQTRYATGQFGPFSEHFHIAKLKDRYEMRVHPVTGDIAFNQSRVQALQSELHCNGGSCPITVFTVIPTSSLRGIHIKAADPNSEHAVKITTSDQAEHKATAEPIRVPPPQLNFVQ